MVKQIHEEWGVTIENEKKKTTPPLPPILGLF